MLVVLKALTIIRKSGLVMPFTVAAVLAAVLAVVLRAPTAGGVAGLALLAGGVLLAVRGRENGVRAGFAAVRARAVRSPGLVAVTTAAALAAWPLAVARRELGLGWEVPAVLGAAVLAVLLARSLASPARTAPAVGGVPSEVGPSPAPAKASGDEPTAVECEEVSW